MTGNLAQTDSEGMHPWLIERCNLVGIRPTLRQLAIKAGITYRSLYTYLVYKRPMPLAAAVKLAIALEIKIDDLISNTDIT